MASFTPSPTRDLLTGGVTTGVVLQLNWIGMAPDIANPYAVAKQHLEHPVPHYLMERQEEESSIPKKKRKRNVRRIEATDRGFLKKGRMQYLTDNGSELLVAQQRTYAYRMRCIKASLHVELMLRLMKCAQSTQLTKIAPFR